MALRRSPKLTYHDYVLFPDDGKRREIIDGELYVSPSPTTRHQEIVLRLAVAFSRFLEDAGGGRVFVAPLDVVLFDTDIVEPDIVFVSDADADVITEKNIKGTPTLLVEVLSDPARDRRLKRGRYARFGVKEYWIVDPDADRVEVYRLAEDGYGKPEIAEPPERLTTNLLPGLDVDLTKLLRR